MTAMIQQLDERAMRLFQGIVERYLEEGEPVGSKSLVQALDLGISSATARNVMAELERAGLIAAPHTSAGRVPTHAGLRLFVDSLLIARPVGEAELARLRAELPKPGAAPNELAEAVSEMLAGMSHLAAVVQVPPAERMTLRQIDFLALSEERVLAILVTSDGDVINRVCHPKRKYSAGELEYAANFLTDVCAGKTLAEARDTVLDDLRRLKSEVESNLALMLEMAEQLTEVDDAAAGLIVRGESNLLSVSEPEQIGRLRGLFEAFAKKREVLALLDQCQRGDGIQIFIGNESGYRFLDDYSVVTSTYEHEGEVVGVLGVIGPTRMPYDRVVSVVDLSAKLLGAALKHRQ